VIARSDDLRQGYGGPPKLYAKAEDPASSVKDPAFKSCSLRAAQKPRNVGFRSGPSNQADSEALSLSKGVSLQNVPIGPGLVRAGTLRLRSGQAGARPYGGCRGNPLWLPHVRSATSPGKAPFCRPFDKLRTAPSSVEGRLA